MLILKKIDLRALIIFILFFSLLTKAKASHSMGADLTYECLGDNQYRITLSFYRDCEGIDAPTFPYIEIKSTCGDYTIAYLDQVIGTGEEVTPTCNSVETTCSNTSSLYTGAQEWLYESVITLPEGCDEWVFSYSTCCRNSAINTIVDPSNMDMYVEAYLNTSFTECNSSPVFTNRPVPFICVGEEFCFNHGAIDADGDSIAYELIDPMVAAGQSVSYFGGYSNANPLASDPQMSFNEETGDFCMTPTMLQVTVMGVLVKEYRDGILIGSVIRDMQLRTLTCSNSNPFTTGINGSGDFEISVCAGQEICFEIPSLDDDLDQEVTVSWNGAIEDAVFDEGTGDRPIAQFCWLTSEEETDVGSYCFTVTVTDDNCPYLGSQTYSFCINVGSMNVSLGDDQEISCLSTVDLVPIVAPDTLDVSFLWSNLETTDEVTVGLGEFIVVATSTSGCVSADTVMVSSNNAPVADFSFPTACENEEISIDNLSQTQDNSPIISYDWVFNGSSISNDSLISLQVEGEGEYELELIIQSENLCKDSITELIIVNPNPVSSFSFENICKQDTFELLNSSTISSGFIESYQWVVPGIGASADLDATFFVAFAGEYDIALAVTSDNGCTVVSNQELTVYEKPIIAFVVDPTCQESTAYFNNLSQEGDTTFASYDWVIGDDEISTDSVFYYLLDTSSSAAVTLTITDNNGCVSSDQKNLTIYEKPELSFNTESHCEGSLAEFLAEVEIDETTNFDFEWIINNQVQNGEEVSYLFNDFGLYPIELNVITTEGCTDTLIEVIEILASPNVQFSFEDVCEDELAGFLDESTIETGSINGWVWDFAGIDMTSSQNASFNFDEHGEYIITLMVSGDNNCISQGSEVILVHDVPEIDFSINNACEGRTVDFVNNSTIAEGVIDSYSWFLNDYYLNGEENFFLTDLNQALYSVDLVIESDMGCSNELNKSFEVFPAPSAMFSYSPSCEGDELIFQQNSFIENGNITQYAWEFGDGSTGDEIEPVHLYDSFNDFEVSLTVTSFYGCVDVFTQEVNVAPKPQSAVVFEHICALDSASFSDASTIAMGEITSWEWKLNDQIINYNEAFSRWFNDPDEHNVQLKVGSNAGCFDSTLVQLIVHPNPQIDFSSNVISGCAPLCVDFMDNSTISDGEIASVVWDIGDEETYENIDPSYCYELDGGYSVTVTAVSDFLCTTELTIEDYISVYPTPVVDFEIDKHESNIYDAKFTFTDHSSNGDQYYWNFGDGDSLESLNTVHEYADSGHYEIIHRVDNQYGCSNYKVDSVYIAPEFALFFPNAFSPNEDGVNDTYLPEGYAIDDFEMLIYDRWGNLIYKADAYHMPWNGRKNNTGEILPIGVYVYKVSVKDSLGKPHNYVGEITLIR